MSGVMNGDGSPIPAEQMGLPAGSWYSTGFGGSQSPDVASVTHGAVLASPAISSPFESSQPPENRPTLAVTAGDTSSFSDDLAVHESALIPAFSDSTGIGRGRPGHAA